MEEENYAFLNHLKSKIVFKCSISEVKYNGSIEYM